MDATTLVVTAAFFASLGLFLWKTRKNNLKENTDADSTSRDLDLFEKLIYKIGSDGLLLISHALFFVTSEKLSNETIRKALMRIGQRHPLARMRITEEDDGRCVFREMEQYAIDFTVSDSSDWVAECERQMQIAHDTKRGPLWRAVLMPNVPNMYCTDSHPHQTLIIFGMDHSFIDGASAMTIYNQLIDDLEAIHQGDTSNPKSQPLPPSLSDCLQFSLPPTDVLNNVCLSSMCRIPFFKQIFLQRMASSIPPNPWTAARGEVSDMHPSCKAATSMIPFELNADLTQKLMVKCKSEGVTMHAAFQVASIGAMSELLGSSSDLPWSTTSTVNMRRIYSQQLDPQHVVTYLGSLRTTHKLPQDWKENFWTFAKEVSTSLHTDIRAEITKSMKMFSTVIACGFTAEDLRSATCNDGSTRNSDCMSLNNLGNCNFLNRPEENVVQLNGWFGASSEHHCGPTFASSIITLNGRILWNLRYFKNVLTKDDANDMAQRIQQEIRFALQ